MSQGRSTRWSLGMGNLPPLIGNPYFMGPYKPLSRTWVDEFIPYYMANNGSLDPIAHMIVIIEVIYHTSH